MFINFLLVGIGGFAGACARYGVNLAAWRLFGLSFPFGVLAVNVAGSFFAGMIVALPVQSLTSGVRMLFYTGFLGAFTTFSAFSADTLSLFNSGAYMNAVTNIILNLLLSLGACFLGYALIKYLAGTYGW